MEDEIGVPSSAIVRLAAFESLLEPLLPLAYRVAYWLTDDAYEARAVVCHTSVLAWHDFGSSPDGFKRGFLRYLTQTSCSRAKRRDRRVRASGIEWFPVHACEQREDAVTRAVAALPEKLRVANVLYFLDNLAYAEIAAIVECAPRTARLRLHRGRQLLRAALNRTPPAPMSPSLDDSAKPGTTKEAPPF